MLRLFLFSFSLLCNLSAYAETCHQSEPKLVQQILNDVNLYRKTHGLNPLQLKQDICIEALKHSRDMASHKMGFGHSGFTKRIQHIYAHVKHPQGAAENVAYNYRNGHEVVKNWLTSSHHLANIRGHYNYTGIGLARDAQGKLYFTQLFLLA